MTCLCFPLLRLYICFFSECACVIISKRNIVCIIVIHSITQYLSVYIGVCHDLFSALGEHKALLVLPEEWIILHKCIYKCPVYTGSASGRTSACTANYKQPFSWHRYQMAPIRSGGFQSMYTSYILPEERKMSTSSAQSLECTSMQE